MGALDGKVAIVTGAGRYRGIGRYIALALARDGADVAVTGSGRPPEEYPADEQELGWRDVESVAEEISAMGRRSLASVLDVSNSDQVAQLTERAVAELGRIDILVNNAASARAHDRVPVIDLEESEWRKVIDVNLTGTFLMTKTVAKSIIAGGNGGTIVNITSSAGIVAGPAYAAYGTSKAGLMHFTKCVAIELAPHGITANCVSPGLIDTYRMEGTTRGPKREERLKSIPLGREGWPEEVGEVVAFLCGKGGAYITGQTIAIDGGRVVWGR